jgi:hypothetical protein
MTIISSAYDAFVLRIETVLNVVALGYTRLPNPYKPEENSEILLRQGYGIVFGPANNTNRQVNCKFSVSRQMEIVLTRQYYAREDDAVSKSTAEKQLFEDQYLLINDFEQDISINGQTMYTRWESDGGIEYVSAGTDRFLMLKTTFALEYLELFT